MASMGKTMAFFGLAPTKKPAPLAPLPVAPDAAADAVEAAARAETVRRQQQRRTQAAPGRASTLLTGPRGLTDDPTTRRATLLGM